MSIAHKLQTGGAIVAVFFGSVCGVAKRPKPAGFTAPVPEQILTARSIFIANEGTGCGAFQKGGFPGGPNRAYNEFYLAMKKWGHYRLANAPADAELEFEISFSCPPVGVNVTRRQGSGPVFDPQFTLSILDVKTGMALWTVTEHLKRLGVSPMLFIPVVGPILISTSLKKREIKHVEKKYEAAMGRLVNDVKALTAQP